MAGDWLKMRHDLADDPAVIRLAELCGDEDSVIGKLFRIWSWADRHTEDGQVEGIGLAFVDRLTRCEGFGAALVRVGWLTESEDGLSFPNFERHCGDTAKARALAKNRQQCRRKGDCHAQSVTNVTQMSRAQRDKSVTREEERREELPPLPREGFDQGEWQKLRKLWNASAGKPWKLVNPPANLPDRLADAAWLEAYPVAIEHLKRCRYFRTPVTLRQFCGVGDDGTSFVEKVISGDFDEPPHRGGRDFSDERPPPRAFTGPDADAFERTRRAIAERLNHERDPRAAAAD